MSEVGAGYSNWRFGQKNYGKLAQTVEQYAVNVLVGGSIPPFPSMGLYVKIQDKFSFSPVLYIHSDEEEVTQFIQEWSKNLLNWAKNHTGVELPLSRLECTTILVDLIYQLSKLYVNTMPEDIKRQDKIQSWLRLYNFEDVKNEEIWIITFN